MDVLVDTNAMRANSVDGVAFKALREYLRKTRSRLLIPYVVIEELVAQRRMQIQQLMRDVEGVRKDLQRLFPTIVAQLPALDTNAALAEYREQILKSAAKVEIIDNSPDDLRELVRRLAGRIPPASPNGEEARDVLIWLNLLAVGRGQHVAFVSGDQKAFFMEGKLRAELQMDLAGFESNVEAFNGLDGMLKVHHARSSFIDKQWLEKQIETEQVGTAIQDFVDAQVEFFRSEIEKRGEPTGYLQLTNLVQHDVEDYFVSDVAQNALYVSLTLWAELEVEVEYDVWIELHEVRGSSHETRLRFIHPCVRLQLQFEVAGENLVGAKVTTIESA